MNTNDPGSRKTVLRPQPGGVGRVAGTVIGAAPASPAAAPVVANVPVQEFIARGINPVLNAAGPLLTLGANVGATVYQADVEGLRRSAEEAVRNFDAQTRAAGVSQDDATIARFILCTFLDSAIMQTPWGGQDVWASRSLLRTFHDKASGLEVFLQILDRLRQDPKRYIDLLELQYACLALGLQGFYRGQPNAAAAQQNLQDDVYRLIRAQRRPGDNELAAHWKGVEQPQSKGLPLVPWWVVAVGALAIVLATLIVLRSQLADRAGPTRAALVLQTVPPVEPVQAAPATPSRLKQLLAPQETAHQVQVDEHGARTVIILTVPELFQSGSAQPTPGHEELLAAVGRALQAVPGRITVEGHTDDQPVRSFRYADNFELSRARAIAIAQQLKPYLSDFSRVQATGLGSLQPRASPPATPENRRLNRRVEIVHVAQ
jgi:type VI secretion system protein ImpK